MATFEDIARANAAIVTTKIQNKEYAEVNQRIKAFRMVYPEGFILAEIDSIKDGVCLMTARVGFYGPNNELVILGEGHAYEKEGSSFINKTSYIENCETSAVGRALGMAGFGIDTSVASAEEVQNAMLNQGKERPADDVYKDHMDALRLIMSELGTKESELCSYYDVKALTDLTDEQIIQAMQILTMRKEKRNAAGSGKQS